MQSKKSSEIPGAAVTVISAIAAIISAIAAIYPLAAYGNIVPLLIILSIVFLAIAVTGWLSKRNTPNEPNGSKRYRFNSNSSITIFLILSALLAISAFILIYNPTTTSSDASSEGEASLPPSSPGKTFGDKNCLPPSDPETSVPGLTVTAPTPGARIGATVAGQDTSEETVTGKAMLAPGEQVHIFLYGPGSCMFYLETRGPVMINSGEWDQMIYPDPKQTGLFELYVVVVDADDGLRIQHVINDFRSRQEKSPWVYRLPPGARSAHFPVICCK